MSSNLGTGRYGEIVYGEGIDTDAFQHDAFQNDAFQMDGVVIGTNGSGQAQASIKVSQRGYGQAQAKIIAFGVTASGQAAAQMNRITITNSGTGRGNSVGTSNTIPLGFTATAGRLIVASITQRENVTFSNTGIWVVVGQGAYNSTGATIAGYATGGETNIVINSSGSGAELGAVSIEIVGATLDGYFAGTTLQPISGQGSTDTSPAATPTTDANCIILGGFSSGDSASNYSAGQNGFTFVGATGPGNPPVLTDPNTGLVYRLIPKATGSYQPGISSRNNKYTGTTLLLYARQPFSSAFGQAQALIKLVNSGSGQAQAEIVSNIKAGYGQAQTWIKRTVLLGVSAQAQAYINDRKPHAQAQAQIISLHINAYGQAQALIEKLPIRQGQAMAMIKHGYYGSGQAQAWITRKQGYGQAQCLIIKGSGSGNAQTVIKTANYSSGQAQALIINLRGFGQAMAMISHGGSGQAQALIMGLKKGSGQAQCYIVKPAGTGQAQCQVKRSANGSGQALAVILKPSGYGQARCTVKASGRAHGQAQAWIITRKMNAQAQAFIDSPRYRVNFNNYNLPGYAQEESIESTMQITDNYSAYQDGSLSEYLGLQNKVLSLRLKTLGNSLREAKEDVTLAATMVRSKTRGFAKLYVQNTDRYYLALTQKISTENTVKSRTSSDYSVEFECKPWLISDATYTVSGTGTITMARSLYNGGWTPARLRITGTDVTVSGYTQTGDFTGFISVSGTVSNMLIDSDMYTSTIGGVNKNNLMNNADYAIYVGPGTTYFDVNGATDCVIEWENRWYL